MENNKILIGVQFTDLKSSGSYSHISLELYVLRDLKLIKLLEGIKYGLDRLSKDKNQRDSELYEKCKSIFKRSFLDLFIESKTLGYFNNLTLTSYNPNTAKANIKNNRFIFNCDDLNKPLCDLGFINSSKLIFDATGTFKPMGKLETDFIRLAFNPERKGEFYFPEYNISTRQLYKFNDEPVSIISPPDPPKKQNHGLLAMIIPSLVTIMVMIGVRMVMSASNTGSSASMIVLSASMGLATLVTTFLSWKRQRSDYETSLEQWKEHYEDYIEELIFKIKERQREDVRILNYIYPDIFGIINDKENGLYSLSDNIYSRSANDDDFLSFRLGISDYVESKFDIKGEKKEVIFSEAAYEMQSGNGSEKIKLYINSELEDGSKKTINTCYLPYEISKRFKYLKRAPLCYSLANIGALGIIDRNIDEDISAARKFISKMIFELCYYHSPEDLQFVVFFNTSDSLTKMDIDINRYMFMPHFHGLFSDKSQFAFNTESAQSVLSSLLGLMSERASDKENTIAKLPHIVFVVFEEYGMKEHAFAEFLPSVPLQGKPFENKLGLSFVFAKKYKEYLPKYCDDIVSFNENEATIFPRSDIQNRKTFDFDSFETESDLWQFYGETKRAFSLLSSVYFDVTAQNGNVPSSVSAFDLLPDNGENLDNIIANFWDINNSDRSFDVTRSLSVPVGKSASGVATIDLHEKADGPHMLVAGTTGSGKTETIISYLIGLCMQYRPDEVNLLLVDMKGGGFTKRIGMLPHVVGAVTDVDGLENGTGSEYMLRRFLFAMQSEIDRRKTLFNEMQVDSIDSYIVACKDIESHIKSKNISADKANRVRKLAKDSLPHLILVVDEFTELKRFSNENSDIDFIGEITTIARIGRSLGLHIILISQNIEGAITDDIRVNSNARLCLKVATRQASKEMLGTDVAASPSMPGNGRAYFLVGTGSKFEYFQSSYTGSSKYSDVPVNITMASKTGSYISFYNSTSDNEEEKAERTRLKNSGKLRNQLELMVESICKTNANMKISKPHMVFLPPLPTAVSYADGKVLNLNN